MLATDLPCRCRDGRGYPVGVSVPAIWGCCTHTPRSQRRPENLEVRRVVEGGHKRNKAKTHQVPSEKTTEVTYLTILPLDRWCTRHNVKLTDIRVIDSTGPNLKEAGTLREQLDMATAGATLRMSGTSTRKTGMRPMSSDQAQCQHSAASSYTKGFKTYHGEGQLNESDYVRARAGEGHREVDVEDREMNPAG